MALLRVKKLEATRQKQVRHGFIDGDDSGHILPPEGLTWQHEPSHPNGRFYGKKACGENFRSLVEFHPPYVDPLCALAGRMMFGMSGHGGWNPDFNFSPLHEEQQRYDIVHGIGAPQHFGADLVMGLRLGFGGILEKIRLCRAKHGGDKAEFFDAEENVVLGMQDWITRNAQAAQQSLERETDPDLAETLRDMADANHWLASNPPRTLLEACQWLAWYQMASRMYNGCGAGCQLDEALRPFYENDIADGRMDDEKATYYLSCLLLMDTRYYQIGGVSPNGQDLTSRISWLILEAAEWLDISCNITVRYHEGMDPAFFRAAVGYLVRNQNGWPRFAGEKGLTEGFMRNGYPRELARQRAAVGCHWMSLPGLEFSLNDCVKINAVKVFEVALWEAMSAESQPLNIAALWDRFAGHLEKAVLCTAKGLDFHLEHQHDSLPELWLNLLCHGPLERALDATHGGVDYYNMCVDGSGLATVADSFAALEQRIERETVLTWNEIATHLRANYAGREGERIRLMMKTADRYGKGGALGDDYALRLSKLFTELVTRKPTPEGRRMIPGWFSWANTISMGRACGATPNGRRAGEPIAHGANPDPGFRGDGAATAMVQAIATVQCGYGNSCPIQMEIAPDLTRDEDAIAKVAALIKTHCDLGGTLFNINVLSKEKLLQANDNPALYPDLVVRVTGFTAYFAGLSPGFRKLVVDRLVSE
jgi:formate C-acetyltransferase